MSSLAVPRCLCLKYSTNAGEADRQDILKSQVAHSPRWHKMEHSVKHLINIFTPGKVRNHGHGASHDPSCLYLLSLKGKWAVFFLFFFLSFFCLLNAPNDLSFLPSPCLPLFPGNMSSRGRSCCDILENSSYRVFRKRPWLLLRCLNVDLKENFSHNPVNFPPKVLPVLSSKSHPGQKGM